MNETRENIEKMVKEYLVSSKKKFVPGETPILTGLAVYDDRELNAMIGALLDGWFGLGKRGREFEEKYSKEIGKKYSTFVNSGSSANFLALAAIKEKLQLTGGEIVTTACTFPTTLNPVIQLGFTPHFVDVDESLNITPENIERAINKNTKGIMFAHTLGNPARIEEIIKIARENNLFVLEDSCDALGSEFNGKRCGSFGDASTASFYPAHIITTGEGGMVSTDDSKINRILKSLRDWGRDCWCSTDETNIMGACGRRFDFEVGGIPYDHRYVYSQIGYNMKPLEIQAAMGLEQIRRLPEFIRTRKRNFVLYQKSFEKLGEHFSFPKVNEGADPVFFGLPVMIVDERINRKDLMTFLNNNKIATRLMFGGNIIHQPAYKNIDRKITGGLSYTDRVFKNLFWIGIHPGVTEEMIDYITEKFSEFVRGALE